MADRPSLTQALLDLGFTTDGPVEEALARQVIFGGTVELNLLELEIVDEDELLLALARSTGLTTVGPGPLSLALGESRELEKIAPGLLVGRANGDERIVIATDAPSQELLETAEEFLGQAPRVLVAPRFRHEEARALLDARPLDARHQAIVERFGESLAARVAREAQTTTEVAVANIAAASVSVPRELTPELTPEMTPEELPEEPRGQYEAEVPPKTHLGSSSSDDFTAPPPAHYTEVTARSVPPLPSERPPESRRVVVNYQLESAIRDLQLARERDRVVEILADFAGQFFEYTAIFSVQSGEARGLTARGLGASRERIVSVHVPLDLPSAFSKAKDARVQTLTRLRASGLEGGILRDLERPTGRAVLLVPVLLRDRAVLILWGDEGPADVDPERSMPVLAVLRHVSKALERVLLTKVRASRMAQPNASESSASLAPQAEVTAPVARLEAPPLRPKTERGMAVPSAAPPPEVARPDVARPVPEAPTPPRSKTDAPPKPDTKRHSAAPEAPRRPSHEPAPAIVRAIEQTQKGAGPALVEFPAEPPKTLRGFPSTPDPGVVLPRNPSPAPVGPPLLSRRVVPLSEQPPAARPPTRTAPGAAGPPAAGRSAASSQSLERAASPGEAPAPELTAHQLGPIRKSGTLVSRRPGLVEPPPDGWEVNIPGTREPVRRTSYSLLVERLIGGDESVVDELLKGGESAIGSLVAHFPGPVNEVDDPALPLAERGPVLAALVRFGAAATPFLTVRTADADPKVRRWAIALLGEAPARDAARAIAGRLLDDSIEVRRAALAAARRVQKDLVTRRTLRAKLEEMTRDPALGVEERCAAVEAIADIREHESIPTLLKLLESEDRSLVRATRWALTVLTRQDFGDQLSQWQAFWQKHREEDRVEWLILALDHREPDLRRAAHEELKSISGIDAPLGDGDLHPERKIAQERYRSWWQDRAAAGTKPS